MAFFMGNDPMTHSCDLGIKENTKKEIFSMTLENTLKANLMTHSCDLEKHINLGGLSKFLPTISSSKMEVNLL